MALFESARKRQRIYMPLKTRVNPLNYMVENGDLPVEMARTPRDPLAHRARRSHVVARRRGELKSGAMFTLN